MVDEISLTYVRINQWGIVITVFISVITQMPIFIFGLWMIQIIGLLAGMRGNLFIRLLRPFIKKPNEQKEAVEMQRFNNTIAVVLLTLAVSCFALGWTIAGFVIAGIVSIAAFVAICGYCIGCTLFFQLKKLSWM